MNLEFHKLSGPGAVRPPEGQELLVIVVKPTHSYFTLTYKVQEGFVGLTCFTDGSPRTTTYHTEIDRSDIKAWALAPHPKDILGDLDEIERELETRANTEQDGL